MLAYFGGHPRFNAFDGQMRPRDEHDVVDGFNGAVVPTYDGWLLLAESAETRAVVEVYSTREGASLWTWFLRDMLLVAETVPIHRECLAELRAALGQMRRRWAETERPPRMAAVTKLLDDAIRASFCAAAQDEDEYLQG
jgi:hypothetical protein